MGSQRVRHNWVTITFTTALKGFPGDLVVRICLPVQEMQETQVQSLGQEDPLVKEIATHSSILGWNIPRTEESGGLQSMGSWRIRHNWVTKHTYTHILNIYSELLCDSAWGSQRDKCTVMFTEALFSIAKRWKQPKCPFRGMDKQSMVLSIQGLRMNTEDLVKQVLAAQLCPTLWDPVDCSPPGSSVHEILQVRILEWDVIPFSRGSSQPRDRTQVSCIAGRFFTVWATREVPILSEMSQTKGKYYMTPPTCSTWSSQTHRDRR